MYTTSQFTNYFHLHILFHPQCNLRDGSNLYSFYDIEIRHGEIAAKLIPGRMRRKPRPFDFKFRPANSPRSKVIPTAPEGLPLGIYGHRNLFYTPNMLYCKISALLEIVLLPNYFVYLSLPISLKHKPLIMLYLRHPPSISWETHSAKNAPSPRPSTNQVNPIEPDLPQARVAPFYLSETLPCLPNLRPCIGRRLAGAMCSSNTSSNVCERLIPLIILQVSLYVFHLTLIS